MDDAVELTDAEFRRACPRAFVVTDAAEERAVVVYARTAIEARRLGHGIDGLGAMDDEWELDVRRAQEFDCLDGRPMREVQLEHGWWFECETCYRRCMQGDCAVVGGDVYCLEHANG